MAVFTNVLDKIRTGYVTLGDQEEALKDPYFAYRFARHVKGADIEKCQEAACRTSNCAYFFALDVKGADVEKCQEAACRDPYWAYYFALSFQEQADIEKCQEAVCKDPKYAFLFATGIKGVDLLQIKKNCPEIADDIDRFIMNKVLK